jgi:FtsH-binding integral membrane protein
MNRTKALYAIAWGAIPIAFALYVGFAYSWSLSRGRLPFLRANEARWWFGFIVALLIGTFCIAMARSRSATKHILWAAVYVAIMSVVLFAVHVGVACNGYGDCL